MTQRSTGLCVIIAVCIAALVPARAASAQAVELLPNLEPFAASDVQLISGTNGLELRFSTTSWNRGVGPLELHGGAIIGSDKQNVYQWVMQSDGTHNSYLVGQFVFHADPTHNHFHFEDYASYTLEPVNAEGASPLVGAKISFCLIDNVKVNTRLPNASRRAVYTTCNPDVQGLSVGWGDRYAYYLEGQSLPFGNNPSGDYLLKIQVDPKGRLHESDTTNNVSCALVRIDVNTLSAMVIGTTCNVAPAVSVSSISPPFMNAGSTVPVVITGSGFLSGPMSVTFANGSGKAPVASNVVVADDHTITANVSVATGGSAADPVWDLRVGSGVLLNSFTVIR